jgi:hypothetical protein
METGSRRPRVVGSGTTNHHRTGLSDSHLAGLVQLRRKRHPNHDHMDDRTRHVDPWPRVSLLQHPGVVQPEPLLGPAARKPLALRLGERSLQSIASGASRLDRSPLSIKIPPLGIWRSRPRNGCSDRRPQALVPAAGQRRNPHPLTPIRARGAAPANVQSDAPALRRTKKAPGEV